jgi:mRNA-degrading endonuclease toxin of MazEF toxin-antitoxin module
MRRTPRPKPQRERLTIMARRDSQSCELVLPLKLASIVSATVVLLFVAGCGGGHGASHRSSTATTAATTAAAPPATVVTESVLNPKLGSTFASSITASSGAPVAFRTVVPGPATESPVKVTLNISLGPERKLTVSATASGHTSHATVISATGKPLTYAAPHYGCPLPPVPTFCPSYHAAFRHHVVNVQFFTTPRSPIIIGGTIGPIAQSARASKPPGSSIVPPYQVNELVQVRPPSSNKPGKSRAGLPKPTSSATARPGDSLVLFTELGGSIHGAPQPITISINQGPDRTIRVSANELGGKPSQAEIRSANGGRIAIVLSQYTCNLPPVATFCPALTTRARLHQYTLEFMAAPSTPPVVLYATVQQG